MSINLNAKHSIIWCLNIAWDLYIKWKHVYHSIIGFPSDLINISLPFVVSKLAYKLSIARGRLTRICLIFNFCVYAATIIVSSANTFRAGKFDGRWLPGCDSHGRGLLHPELIYFSSKAPNYTRRWRTKASPSAPEKPKASL